MLPKCGDAFCRALTSTDQEQLGINIQPEGVNWSISLRSVHVLTYDGQILALHPYTVPEVQAHLDKQPEVKLLVHGDLYVITSCFQDHIYVGLHK